MSFALLALLCPGVYSLNMPAVTIRAPAGTETQRTDSHKTDSHSNNPHPHGDGYLSQKQTWSSQPISIPPTRYRDCLAFL